MANTSGVSTSSDIPDWSAHGFIHPQGVPISVASLEAWGRLLSSERRSIELPVFQRGTAWNEARIELFWDSLARGYPIGTLLLSTMRVKSRSIPNAHNEGSTLQTSTSEAYDAIVVDGQQRCVALKLGFRDWHPGDTNRLWIDLVSAAEFFKRAPYLPNANPFRLCSSANPWGKIRGTRPSLSQRRRARKMIGHEEFSDQNLPLDQTFPLFGSDYGLPVPLNSLLSLVLYQKHISVEQCLALVPDGALIIQGDETHLVSSVTKQQRTELEHMAIERIDNEQLKAFLNHIRERLKSDSLIACFSTQIQKGDDLIESFVRVNRQGVALSEAELFFSGLKHEWDEANNLVHNIVSDMKLGHMLKATEIVHAALRLALTQTSDPEKDVPRLSLDEFRKLLRTDSNEKKKIIEDLGSLLRIQDGTKRARLHDLLLLSRGILEYKPGVNNSGLPKPLLATIRWRTWHALLAWFDRHNPNKDVIEKSQLEIMRFVLLDHLFIGSDSVDVIRKPFFLAQSKSAESLFPGREIFADLKGYLSPGFLTPRDYQELVEQPDAPWSILRDEWALLLWAQRNWLDRWFPKFDPAAAQVADDLPYDIDHIMPSNFFDGRSVGNRIAQEITTDFERNKSALRESIGNKRAWPREANRSDHDEAPTGKLFLDRNAEDHIPEDHPLKGWKVNTVGAVWQASLIPESEVKLWRESSGDSDGDWTDPNRFTAFRKAVNARRVRLYESFFQEFGYEEWLPSEQVRACDGK
ncbi:MAG: DUF262 domain-containing protein [Nitrospira sp.]